MKKNILSLLLLCCLACSPLANASDIVDVLPLTSKILVIHFDDGYVIHHKRGQQRTDEQAITDPLNILQATLLGSYTLLSNTDANYSTAKNPSDLGRKSKGTEFALICDSYINGKGCINSHPDYAQEHWIYLYLPTDLQTGKIYTLTLNNLAKNKNVVTFTYDETQLRSEAIHVNNLGYAPAAPAKYAYLYHWAGDKGGLDLAGYVGKNFTLFNTDTKQVAFTGQIAFRKGKTNLETGQPNDTPVGNFESADVYECDFSAFTTPGNYVLSVPGMGCSFSFKMDEDAYREAFYWTMKGLYQNRSGIELKSAYTDFTRPAPHNTTLTPGFSGRLKYSTFRAFDLTSYDGDAKIDKPKVEAGFKGTLNTYGWYQDAGDWDGYYTHTHVPALLMFLYEAGRNKFVDNELNIPESGNGIPDILDEAAWLLRYLKRTKDEIKQKGYGTGGIAGARVFGDFWGGDERADGTTKASWEDTDRDWYVLGEDVWTTYKYAGLAAQMAYILATENKTDPLGVDWKQEAIDAYAWAKANTKPADEPTRLEINLKDLRMYASASLYRLTNQSQYHTQFISEAKTAFTSQLNQDNRDLSFAAYTYLLLPSNRTPDATTRLAVLNSVTGAANFLLTSTAANRACRWGGDFYFPMLIGHQSTPMIIAGIYGYVALKTASPAITNQYLTYIYTTADYFLGCNPLNTTWITGVGERYPTGLFHLDWWYGSNQSGVIKGVVPYGAFRVQSFGDLGWFNPNFAYSDASGNARIYPTDVAVWPGHERWFDQRTAPPTCEFTIHQNGLLAAFTYGFLTKDKETKTIVLLADSPNAVEPDLEEDNLLLVYPNPTDSFVTIQTLKNLRIQSLELYKINGSKVAEQKNPKFNQGIYRLELNHPAAGIYLLKCKTPEGKTLTRKVQIIR